MNPEYNRPMYFEADEGVVLNTPEFEYDMTIDQGRTLKVGLFDINEKTFRVELKTMAQLHPRLKNVLSKSEANKMIVAMRWPNELFREGLIELISRDGDVLWKFELTEKLRSAWEGEAAKMSAAISRKEINKEASFSKASTASYVFKNFSSMPIFKQKQPFRFCFTKSSGIFVNRLCTQKYGIKYNGRVPFVASITSNVSPRVIVQKEPDALKGSIKVPADDTFSFYAELANGQSYEFISPPPKLSLMDFAESLNPQMARVVGHGLPPLSTYAFLNSDQYSSLTKILGFEATIFDPRKFWIAEIAKENPVLYFPGPGGGVFKQSFVLDNLPQARSRPYLATSTPPGTYLSEKIVYGRKLAEDKIASDQVMMKINKKNPSIFEWTFAAPKKAEYNRSFVQITHEGKVYKSFYELYRAYANEFSARIGVLAPANANFMGEVAYAHWFESLLGWRNNTFSVQRWGLSTKYFTSLSPVSVNDDGTTVSLAVLNADLKYRFTQGLWLRDETTGFSLSYQEVNWGELKIPMAGGGWFWARSMPKVFDGMFNFLPFMDYPKWVEFEFMYYAITTEPGVTLNTNLALNFHGQVLWTPSFFGEMGFGLKRYAFDHAPTNQRIELNTFFGTLGIGFKF